MAVSRHLQKIFRETLGIFSSVLLNLPQQLRETMDFKIKCNPDIIVTSVQVTEDSGISYFDLGRKKASLLPNGCYARKIRVSESGKATLLESESLYGRGSQYLWPSAFEVEQNSK